MFVDDVLGPPEPKRAPPWDRRAPARLPGLGAKEEEEKKSRAGARRSQEKPGEHVLDEHLPREKKVGARERTTSSGSLVFMKHQPSQLELFSNQRRRSKTPPSKSEVRQAPPTTRRSSHVPHSARPEAHGNLHIVWRIARGLPALRTPRALRRLERAFRLGKQREGFALIHCCGRDGA
jgi:hypothetical protein